VGGVFFYYAIASFDVPLLVLGNELSG